MAPERKPATICIQPTDEDFSLVRKLMRQLGLNQSSIVRLGLRVLAKKEGVTA
jgi:hypothetical protein